MTGSSNRKPYSFVRFTWWRKINLRKVAEDLGPDFTVKTVFRPRDEMELVLRRDERDELWVYADTLTALLRVYSAGLYQTDVAPFTQRDMALRKNVFALYPRNRPTPFPLPLIVREPEFEML